MTLPVFASLVVVLRNRETAMKAVLEELSALLTKTVAEHELIVVDNASTDGSVSALKALCGQDGMPNLQVYALTKEVDRDTASWVGAENALGDFVAIFDPATDDASFLPAMLEAAVSGKDVVFASNKRRAPRSLAYRFAAAIFDMLYGWFAGVHLVREAPAYRVISKRVVSFVLQHPFPALVYRHLPATAGFARANLSYDGAPRLGEKKRLGDAIEQGVRLLITTSRAPMRLVTALSLFGAVANILYSGYVIAVAVFKEDVAPGWVTLSLQQSGMFFLISLVLLVLGEYILHMARLSNEGPAYHLAQEFTSAVITRRQKLNVEG